LDEAAAPQGVASLGFRGRTTYLPFQTTDNEVKSLHYVALGRPTRESQEIKGGTTRNIDAFHDKGGNRTGLTYPGGREVNHTFDMIHRISAISDGANTRARFLYVVPSRRSQVQLLNGASTVNTLKSAEGGAVKLGLRDAYGLLDALGDPLGEHFRDANVEIMLGERNKSILAHGFSPVSVEGCEAMRKAVMRLAGMDESELVRFPRLSYTRAMA